MGGEYPDPIQDNLPRLSEKNLLIHESLNTNDQPDPTYAQQCINRERFQHWRQELPGYVHSDCPRQSTCRDLYTILNSPTTLFLMNGCVVNEDEDPVTDPTLPRPEHLPQPSDLGPEMRFAMLDAVDSAFPLSEKYVMIEVDHTPGSMEGDRAEERTDAAKDVIAEVMRLKAERQSKARVKRDKRRRVRKRAYHRRSQSTDGGAPSAVDIHTL
ncbi:hypothetical protein NA57DRAFT_59733 [Rhizodiscina lignyota]|uniref:Uncharacterized protein n=1 Tax=Rhizodiscina lignyota TaxID=1504668 RepID=A0A9P4M7E9_9PEZI|nr:hypothetical protein NA57DRAFT_59733 [Rhizodiscina lignyota]